jgi:hypothetical protein
MGEESLGGQLKSIVSLILNPNKSSYRICY